MSIDSKDINNNKNRQIFFLDTPYIEKEAFVATFLSVGQIRFRIEKLKNAIHFWPTSEFQNRIYKKIGKAQNMQNFANFLQNFEFDCHL